MDHEIPLQKEARADQKLSDGTHEVTADVAYLRLAIVNVVLFGTPAAGDGQWVLIDAGLIGTASRIADAVEARFGEGARPSAIVMAHGHFDHVGALKALAQRWDVPIYAHPLELPYLDGRSPYPPPDPKVGGGLMSALSPFYPRGPINVRRWLLTLPEDGAVPGMPGWRWIHTPGHSPGHISLWRERDRVLIAGDAVVTTKQESAYAAVAQPLAIHGPPMYYTSDWDEARTSVELLAALNPEIIVSGHGQAVKGAEMREALHALARHFDQIARPSHGRYVDEPARADEKGVTHLPPS